jgi:prepilin-type N-terminal cleavage/methylation domain-containing protein
MNHCATALSQGRRVRPGFTLVELLIVIAIIGALVGLLLPAINAARESARQATCTNNQKNIAVAMQNYATTGKGEFPGWAGDMKLGDGQTISVPWSTRILAQLDEQTLRDQLLQGRNMAQPLLQQPNRLDVYVCPSNQSTTPNFGALTYVVNAGMPDPANIGNGPSDLESNGVCHDQRAGRRGPSVQFSRIPDGADSTLLVAENVHKDDDISSPNNRVSWLGFVQADPFVRSGDMSLNPEQRYGMTWVYDRQNPYAPAPGVFAPINRDIRTGNTSFAAAGPQYARPASGHPELFIAAFCGGNVRSIRETIDYKVYQQLMTPAGLKAADVSNPNVMIEQQLQSAGGGFMVPPLSDSDY